jgi:hypothetical protein
MNRKCLAALLISSFVLVGCGKDSVEPEREAIVPSQPPPKPASNEVVVKLTPTNVQRTGEFHIKIGANGQPIIESPRKEKLVVGEITTLGANAAYTQTKLYLPAHGPYPVTSKENHHFDNTSTAVSVDANLDGRLAKTERWFASMPIRLGDQMFTIRAVDPGAAWVLLAKSSAPLAGAVVGKPCPPFEFMTMNGDRVSLAQYKGKALLLDIWSMT